MERLKVKIGFIDLIGITDTSGKHPRQAGSKTLCLLAAVAERELVRTALGVIGTGLKLAEHQTPERGT